MYIIVTEVYIVHDNYKYIELNIVYIIGTKVNIEHDNYNINWIEYSVNYYRTEVNIEHDNYNVNWI